MLIDWFTVGAQALNFLILVWLLKRFLYQPVIDAIDAREKRIAAELAAAATKEAAALVERETFKKKNEEFEQQRAALFSKASAEAQAERQRLLEGTRKEVDALRTRLKEAMHNEQQILSDEITGKVREEVFAIARKTLSDLATTNLEESMTRVFIDRLRALSDPDRNLLKAALTGASRTAILRSAFDLPAQQRMSIERTVEGVTGVAAQLRFEIVPGLVSGVELTAGGQRFAWSIADYLGALENRVRELLTQQSTPDGGRGPTPHWPVKSPPDSKAIPTPMTAAVLGTTK